MNGPLPLDKLLFQNSVAVCHNGGVKRNGHFEQLSMGFSLLIAKLNGTIISFEKSPRICQIDNKLPLHEQVAFLQGMDCDSTLHFKVKCFYSALIN